MRTEPSKAPRLTWLAIVSMALLAPSALALPVIVNVVETGGDNEPTDTVTAKWTGVTYVGGIANEPVPGLPAGASYTVGVFGNHAPAFVDRNHRYTNAEPARIPSYLVGREYIMSGNDNRDNAGYQLDVTVNRDVQVFLLIDNRLQDGDGATPPTFGPTNMQWVVDQGWAAVRTGANRFADPNRPDEVGIDESADGTINQYYSVYTKRFQAGTFQLKQADNAGRNMYGVVVNPDLPVLNNFAQLGRIKTGSFQYDGPSPSGEGYTIVGGGNDTWDINDEMAFAYHEFCGDFDIRVQVTELEPTGQWSKAGIQARESLAEDARRVCQTVSPLGSQATTCGANGANTMEFLWRTGIQDGAGENGGQNSISVGNPIYPQWIRLVRRGTTITGYASRDGGLTWPMSQAVDTSTFQGGALPSKLFVGLSVSRHPCASKQTCRAVFNNYTERYTDADQRFCVVCADSKGCPNQIFVTYNRPYDPVTGLDFNNYSLQGGIGEVINGVLPGPDPNTVILDVEDLSPDEGATFAVSVFGVTDTQGVPLDAACAGGSFVHAAGFELRRIHVQHNKQDNTSLAAYYKQTAAYAFGAGSWTEGRPPFEGNNLFEDPMPDGDAPNNYASRIIGVLSPSADGNYVFACSSDDNGELYLSSDDQPSHKSLIASEPQWNGRREYASGSNQGSRGSPPANISTPKALLGGGKYLLEFIYEEGGGGNNGSVTWDAGTGAPFVNGQDPLSEANFIPCRFAYGVVFYNLGCVTVTRNPTDVTVPVASPATFSVALDGTPPYNIQWYKNGAPVPGAKGLTYTIPAATDADNGAKIKVRVSNVCCANGVESAEATLTVLLNPKLQKATSKGNCHAVYVQYNKPMQLDGVYSIVCSNTVDGTITPLVVTAVNQGSTPNEVRLAVTPDLLPDTNVYTVIVLGAHSQDGLVVDPNPSSTTFIHGAEFPPFKILYKKYEIGSGPLTIPQLLAHPKVVNNQPDEIRTDFAAFETPWTDHGENHGDEAFGWIRVPQDGDYRLWCASDDYSVTYIATDANPAHAVPVNFEPAWANYRSFTDAGHDNNDNRGVPPANESAPIHLTAGQLVYIRALWTDGCCGDHYSSYATIVPYGDPDPGPPANDTPSNLGRDLFVTHRVSPRGCFFTTLCDVFCNPGPSDQTVFQGQTATFNVTADGTPADDPACYFYQWFKNGVAIAGATSSSYSTPLATAADDGAVFTVEVRNDFSANRCSAVLHVRPNPVVVRAVTLNDPNHVYVYWTKDVLLNGSYTLVNAPIVVNGWAYGSASNIVVVETEPMSLDTTYTLEIADVTDPAGNLQVPNPDPHTFVQGPGRFCADFSDGQLPPGTVSSGTTPPAVGDDGTGNMVLHLTDHVNSQANYWTIPLAGAQTFQSLKAQWKTLIEGVGGADGISFNVGENMGTAFTPEDGAANGLAVCVDTYNNGAGDAGLDIKYNGATLTHLPVPPPSGGADGAGAPAELAIGQFVDTTVDVTPSGFVTFQYANFVITAQIPNYAGLKANQYIFAARTGGANENCWIDNVCINDYVLGSATVALECPAAPAECSPVTLRATASGSPPLFYQWQLSGTDIPGATAPTYTTPVLHCPADDGAVYTVTVHNDFSAASASCTIRLACDNTPPAIAVVGSLDGRSVGVIFTEAVDPASATDPAHYTITDVSGPHAIVPPILLRADGRSVAISLATPVDCAFTVAARGVLDLCPGRNASDSTKSGEVAGLTGTTLGAAGDPAPPGVIEGLDIIVGGSDIWGTADQGYFAYTSRMGDFDMQVKVETLEFKNRWSKAGLDARISLDANSPHIMSVFTPFGASAPDGSGSGADGIDAGVRSTPGGDTGSWGGLGAPVLSAGINWMRLQRVGDHFSAYHSSDGVNWLSHAEADAPGTPATLYVGLAVTSHNNGTATRGQFSNFQITPGNPDTTPPVLTCPGNVTAQCSGGLTPVTYDPTAVDNCGGPVTVTCVPPSGSGFRLGTSNVVCTATDSAGNPSSCTFTVTVVDTVPPRVTCPADITAPATGPDGAVVTYIASASDPCGLSSFACTPPSGSTFPLGPTTVVCTAGDSAGNSSSCSFTVTVRSPNEPPVCDTKFPCSWTEAGTFYTVALDGATACVVLDGSGSTDPDNDPLTFTWIVDGTNQLSGAVVTNCLSTGCHSVVLVVKDRLAESRCERRLCVITAGEAVEQTIALVESTNVARKNKRPLIATLKAAQASFDRGSFESGLNQLQAFQNKVRAQIAPANPAEAAAFIASAQRILDGIACASE